MRPIEIHATIPPTEPIGLKSLTRVRWITIAAGVGAVVAGRSALEIVVPPAPLAATFGVWAGTNVWLSWRLRGGATPFVLAGSLVLADVAILTALLFLSGGILNPAAVFYIVQIVMSALVLGRVWTWLVTACAVAGYASLYLVPTDELDAAVTMHREVGLHMRGMWLAFAATALIVALLVTRLAMAVERRDRALEALREKTARATRAAGLATLAAGAAHELGTPLSTIAVAARELERRLAEAPHQPDLLEDARLIRSETDRCRHVLEAMAGESGQTAGETPRPVPIGDLVNALRGRLGPGERSRLDVAPLPDLVVVWPVSVVSRALCNVVQNGLQASPVDGRVRLDVSRSPDGRVEVRVIDRGTGMARDELARAGEPFFTTKPAGKGTGLGLFVTRSTVEQLGGALTMTSTPGAGTTVTMLLPRDVVGLAKGQPDA